MGYSYYEGKTPLGRPMKMGYGVVCKCHHYGCTEKIDRGLGYVCYSCGWYYCSDHKTVIYDNDDELVEFDCFVGKGSEICLKCEKELLKDKIFREEYNVTN